MIHYVNSWLFVGVWAIVFQNSTEKCIPSMKSLKQHIDKQIKENETRSKTYFSKTSLEAPIILSRLYRHQTVSTSIKAEVPNEKPRYVCAHLLLGGTRGNGCKTERYRSGSKNHRKTTAWTDGFPCQKMYRRSKELDLVRKEWNGTDQAFWGWITSPGNVRWYMIILAIQTYCMSPPRCL